MSKEAVIIQEFNEKERKYEYFVKGFDVTESVKILLKRHKEEYDKEKNIFAGTQGFIEAQQLYEKQIADLEAKLAESEEHRKKAYQEGLLQKQFDKDAEIMQLKQQLAENDTYKLRIELAGATETIEVLKKQLAEKEKKIEEKNRLIIQEDGECLLCGDCYCINNDVRKIVEENTELKNKIKDLEYYNQTLKRYVQTGNENIEELWCFVEEYLTLENVDLAVRDELPNKFKDYDLVEFRKVPSDGYLFVYRKGEDYYSFKMLRQSLICLLNEFKLTHQHEDKGE